MDAGGLGEKGPSDCLAVLQEAEVQLIDGLSEHEVTAIEREFGFAFSPDHRALLTAALPTGPGWPNWRDSEPDAIAEALAWPVQGVLFDARNNAFWPSSWGTRPDKPSLALEVATKRLDKVPRLVPLFGHRYMSAAPAPTLSPVFSVYQTDVIYYGPDLLTYLRHEFLGEPPSKDVQVRIPFWSDLAEGLHDADL